MNELTKYQSRSMFRKGLKLAGPTLFLKQVNTPVFGISKKDTSIRLADDRRVHFDLELTRFRGEMRSDIRWLDSCAARVVALEIAKS